MMIGSVLAVPLLVIAAACWQNSAQSTSPATHSSMSRQKGVVSQPHLSPAKNDTENFSALLISINGEGELLLSDRSGRKLGYDAQTQKNFQEIPGGVYDNADDIDDDDAQPAATPAAEAAGAAQRSSAGLKRIEVPEAQFGEYILKVSSQASGTYSLNVASLNKQGKQSTADFKNVTLPSGVPQVYRIVIAVDGNEPLLVTWVAEANHKPGQ